MEKVEPELLIKLIEDAWAEWNERGTGSPKWQHFVEKLSLIVGCAPESFVVKVVQKLIQENSNLLECLRLSILHWPKNWSTIGPR